jgi:cyclopropane fatty-acyl-phospholipid synthase-like methyltransferase
VLEIGAGPGTFVIPFAKVVKRIVAVEPSKGMIRELEKNAEEAGVENFEIIAKKWEDVDISEIGKYDLVISSIVLWIFKDVWNQIRRMEMASKGYCCAVTGVNDWGKKEEELWRKIMGDIKRPSYSEYPLIYNLLYSKGRYPNVEIIEYTTERTVESKIQHRKLFYSKFIEVTPEIENIIREFVISRSENGIYREKGKAAVIWWKV